MADQRNEYKRILITGASSYVGSYLCRKFSDAVKLQNTDVKVYGFYNTHSINFKGIIPVRCDITKEDSFSSLFKEITPDVVYHLASLTPMRSLGRDSGTVFRINKEVTGHIAELCAGINSLMIYTSTDLVYKEGTDLREGTSDTGPVTPYAASKLEGEKEIIRHGCRTIILRMSLVYGFSISSYTSFFDTAYDDSLKDARALQVRPGRGEDRRQRLTHGSSPREPVGTFDVGRRLSPPPRYRDTRGDSVAGHQRSQIVSASPRRYRPSP